VWFSGWCDLVGDLGHLPPSTSIPRLPHNNDDDDDDDETDEGYDEAFSVRPRPKWFYANTNAYVRK